MGDRRKLGYWNRERIVRAEEASKLIRQKVGALLGRIKRIHAADVQMKMELLTREIDGAAADIFVAMKEIEIEQPPGGEGDGEEEGPPLDSRGR